MTGKELLTRHLIRAQESKKAIDGFLSMNVREITVTTEMGSVIHVKDSNTEIIIDALKKQSYKQRDQIMKLQIQLGLRKRGDEFNETLRP